MAVSPIQTPVMSRPETRENQRLTRQERLAQIMNGQVNHKCPADTTVINLYIASGLTDAEAERSFMQEHLYPHLRTYCKERGHELRVIDLHWGFKDVLTDDHSIPELMTSYIKRAREPELGVNFVIFLGQRYGTYLLPAEIPKAEYEALCAAARAYRDKHRGLLQMKMLDIHTRWQERDKLKTIDESSSSAGTPSGSSNGAESARESEKNPTSARTNTTEDTEDRETSSPGVSATAKELRRKQSIVIKKDQQLMKQLKEAEEQLPDADLLDKWYELDENAVPAVYRLQNISTVYKDINRNDAGKRSAAKSSFAATASQMVNVLQKFGSEVIADKIALQRYYTSALSLEVEEIFKHDAAAQHTVVLVRTIEQLTTRLDDVAAPDYTDRLSEKPPKLDTETSSRIDDIRMSLPTKVPEHNTGSFLLEWSSGGVRPAIVREHAVYTERVCRTVSDMVKRNLAASEEEKVTGDTMTLTGARGMTSRLCEEIAQHVRTCQEKARSFQGRKEHLTLVKSYLKAKTRRPLILYGKTGCGKSAIIGKVAKEISRWYRGSDQSPRVLVRMIGSTMTSTNVRMMLRDVCLQLCHMYGHNPAEIPTVRPSNITFSPYCILLTDENEGRKLQWLPPELPPHVRLIISTVSEDKFDCLPSARKLLAEHEDCLVEVGQLPEHDAMIILGQWLEKAHRNLTDLQFEVLVEAFKKCPYPLFLKLAFTEVVSWTSYMKSEFIKLGDNVKKIATLRFGRLERDHGEPLVRRALGYISASRNGIASNEMEDILSLDEAVMDDVMTTHKPPRRRLPTLLWLRLREDMRDLISESRADDTRTITWAHSTISEASDERYLVQRDKAPSYHKALAEYFLGLWAGKAKPYSGNDKGSDRLVSEQNFFFEPENSLGDGSDRLYNLRKINELPFHLTRAQQTSTLKQECLCNFEWMLAKLCGTSLRALFEEYQTILMAEPHEPELRLLSDVLHLSGKALRSEPRQLASQIIGRLYRIITTDNPRAPGDPKKYPNLHPLLAAAKNSSVPALIPSVECLTEPGGILFDLLSGHSDPITALALTTDGMRALTSSKDGTIKLWDIRSGKVVKSIDGIGPEVSAIRTAKSNTLAFTVEKSVIKAWSLKTGKCMYTIDEYPDPACISVAAEGQVLACVFGGANIFRSWSVDDFSLLCEAEIPDNSVHKDNSILIADSSYGEHVLHAFRSGNFATVQHARSGKMMKTLQCHDKSSSIVALAISREYFILCCRQQFMALHEIHTLELFDAKRGTYIRSVRGCIHDSIRCFFVNLIGSHAIAVCATARNNTSDIALWNLETEDHKHLATHPCVSTMGACLDFRYCMTGAEGENSLRIWDLTSKVNQPAPKLKKQLGVCDIWPMIDNPRYVVAKAINNGPISVWNLIKGKCLQSAVRIERGLTEGSDALIMRNTRLVILTDRGFSNVTEDARPVFQTVLVYDLKLKKYVRKLPGCYIVPAPSHEYVLLDNDSLLGPSDNRSHFIIWNLVTGHASSRIKTGFRELERRRMEQGIQITDVPLKVKRKTSAQMTPWDRRSESKSARRRRQELETEKEKQRLEELRKEKDNVVEQFLVSGDQKTIVAAFYAHHLCVFDIPSQLHTQTLQTEYSMMFLHTAALTHDGGHLVIANYDEDSKISYVTLWDCTTGEVKRRLKKETNVSALAITDDAQRVIIGRSPNELHVWDPMKNNSLRRIRGYEDLRFEMNSKIFIVDDGQKAVVFAGDISMWDIEKGTVLSVFSPDTRIMTCNVVLNGQLIVFGLYDKPELVILKLTGDRLKPLEDTEGVNLFGETNDETTDDDEDEDEED
ncbi:uncharacterized protein LOC101859566 [Aplysia californica]|uniref:Uncharacterized protein LOC101859566 n=1 Tax=Aplysia californica TaxID=6500 RepID=A0ABM1VS69_APLCA|nr:uncharacterized protein LOC101859566 [Aplysia californica]